MTIRSSMSEIDNDKYERIFGRKKKDKIAGSFVWRDGTIKRKVVHKGNGTFNIIPDNYDSKSFVTADITGEPIEITSRSQERRIMKQAGVIRREKGMRKDDKRERYKENYRIQKEGLGFDWNDNR